MSTTGWHPDPKGEHELRYHDGTDWTADVSDAGVQAREALSATEREQILERETVKIIAGGANVLSQSATEVVYSVGKRPNHLLHLVLSLVTVGLWALFVWLPLGLFSKETRYVLRVDEQGRPVRSKR